MKAVLLSGILATIAFSNPVSAQVTVADNTNFAVGTSTPVAVSGDVNTSGNMAFANGSRLILTGSGTLTAANALVIPNIVMSGSAYNLSGQWTITESLSLLSGTIAPDGAAQIIIGPAGTVVAEDGAHINGKLFHSGTGEKFYPVGVSGTYAPVTLHSVQGADDLLLGVQAHNGNPGVTTLPDDVQAASTNWYWELTAEGTFSGSTVTLPVLQGDEALITGDDVQAVVLEAGSDGASVNNLGNGLSADATTVRSEQIAVGPNLLLGSRLVLVPVIHNIITPNNDGKNDYLIIDAVNVYSDNNEVIILDRWGTEVYRQKNFRNFDDIDNPYDGSFEFLASGNYICILKYGNEQTLKQTITVLK